MPYEGEAGCIMVKNGDLESRVPKFPFETQ